MRKLVKYIANKFHRHQFNINEGSLPYFKIGKTGELDGIGRKHVNIYGICCKCDKVVLIGKTHVDSNNNLNK